MKFQVEHNLSELEIQVVLQRSLVLGWSEFNHASVVERWLDNPEEAKAEVEQGLIRKGMPSGAESYGLRGELLRAIATIAANVIAIDNPGPQLFVVAYE